MTDEFYGCRNCGAFNETTYMKYHSSDFRTMTKDEMENILDILNMKYEDTSLEEVQYCSCCNEEYDGVLVASTEKC